jgi:hypothetical protein
MLVNIKHSTWLSPKSRSYKNLKWSAITSANMVPVMLILLPCQLKCSVIYLSYIFFFFWGGYARHID